MKIGHGWNIDIPSNAMAINTNKGGAIWLEPIVRKKSDDKKEEKEEEKK